MNAAIEMPVKLARARCETPVERAPELLDLVVQAATPIVTDAMMRTVSSNRIEFD
jgi:hypothetical protein